MTHDNAFSHLRLFAAALVLFSHQFALWGRPEPSALGLTLGTWGVAIFFGISGYLVTQSLAQDPNATRFLWRRALRVTPGLALNTLFCAVLLGAWLSSLPAADYFVHEQFRAYFWNLAFSPRYALPGVFDTVPMPHVVNGSLWTLPFEMLAYLGLAGLLLLGLRPLRWVLPLMLVLALTAAVLWQPAQPVLVWANDLRHLPRFMALFLVGACLALWQNRIRRLPCLLGLLLAYAAFDQAMVRLTLLTLMLPLAAVLVGSLQLAPHRVLRNDLSYGLYLYAFPVQQTLIALAAPLGLWATLVLAFVIALALAFVSWHGVERPALGLKPRRRVVPTLRAAAE